MNKQDIQAATKTKFYTCDACKYTFPFFSRPKFCPNCGKPKVHPKSKSKQGRPRKKPDYDKEAMNQEQLDRAVALFVEPLDDRVERSKDAPSISSVAEAMHTSTIRVKKMLITAGYYSTATSRKVQELRKNGLSFQEIMDATGLKRASIWYYLPYSRGIYNLSDPTLCAEHCRLFQKRKRTCAELKKHLDSPNAEKYLWDAIQAFNNYLFRTADGLPLRYSLKGEELSFTKDDKQIPKGTIIEAFHSARATQMQDGFVGDSTALGISDVLSANDLYAVFLRIGVCKKDNSHEETL